MDNQELNLEELGKEIQEAVNDSLSAEEVAKIRSAADNVTDHTETAEEKAAAAQKAAAEKAAAEKAAAEQAAALKAAAEEAERKEAQRRAAAEKAQAERARAIEEAQERKKRKKRRKTAKRAAITLILLPLVLIFKEQSLYCLQSVTIIGAAPVAIILILIVASFFKDAREYLKSPKP